MFCFLFFIIIVMVHYYYYYYSSCIIKDLFNANCTGIGNWDSLDLGVENRSHFVGVSLAKQMFALLYESWNLA